MTRAFDVAGLTFTVSSVIAVVAAMQWLLITLAAAVSKEKPPKKGMRAADVRLLVSTAVFAIAWMAIFSTGSAAPKTAAAAAIATKSHASCSIVVTDMAADVVRAKLGAPDEVRLDEETRGPGAAIWLYRDSRCAVHILDDKVEFVD